MMASKAKIKPFTLVLDSQAQRVYELVESLLNDEGFELVWLKVVPQKNMASITFFVDCLDPESSIKVEELTGLNRLLGDFLAVAFERHGLFARGYNLEVSSPGLDRPLSRIAHFQKVLGETVKIKTIGMLGLPRTVLGRLESVDDNGIGVKTKQKDLEKISLNWSQISSAHLVWKF